MGGIQLEALFCLAFRIFRNYKFVPPIYTFEHFIEIPRFLPWLEKSEKSGNMGPTAAPSRRGWGAPVWMPCGDSWSPALPSRYLHLHSAAAASDRDPNFGNSLKMCASLGIRHQWGKE